MTLSRALWGINIILIAGILALGFFAWQVSSDLDRSSDKVGRLEQELASSTRDLADQLTQVEQGLSSQLTQLQQGLSEELQTARGQLETTIATLGAKTADQSGELEEAKAQLEEISEQLTVSEAALSESIADQGTELERAKARLEEIHGQLAVAEAALSAQIADQGTGLIDEIEADRTRLQDLQTQLERAEADLGQQTADLGGDIQAVSGALQDLQTEADNLARQIAEGLIDVGSLYQQMKDSIVEIQVVTAEGEAGGSGFIYGDQSEYVVTAHHVVVDASEIKVITLDGQEINASVVGQSDTKDVAVLKLAEPLAASPLLLADSSKVNAGDPVMVVGTPFGLVGTVTTGIVSAVGRKDTFEGYSWDDLIQFDAAANPGNSGGPLINSKGEVIGLVSLGVKATSGWGISMAVPSNTIKEVIDPFVW